MQAHPDVEEYEIPMDDPRVALRGSKGVRVHPSPLNPNP